MIYITGMKGRTWIRGLALAIIAAALWEWLFRPGMGWLTRAVLTVTTLGADTLRDDVYREVALGLHETGSVLILRILLLALGAGTGLAIRQMRPPAPERSGLDRVAVRIVNSALFNRVFTVFLVINFLATMVAINRNYYVNAVITNFNQLVSATAPYLGPERVIEVRSRFAQVQRKSDLVTLVSEINAVADTNGVKHPKLWFW